MNIGSASVFASVCVLCFAGKAWPKPTSDSFAPPEPDHDLHGAAGRRGSSSIEARLGFGNSRLA